MLHQTASMFDGDLCFIDEYDGEIDDAEKGADLRALVQDREFGDGVHFAYVFRTDSTFSGMEMGRKERGTWRIVRDEWCWKWTEPAAAEECYRVQRGGAQVRLMRNGSETWRGTLRKTR